MESKASMPDYSFPYNLLTDEKMSHILYSSVAAFCVKYITPSLSYILELITCRHIQESSIFCHSVYACRTNSKHL